MRSMRERESDTPSPELTESRKMPNKKPPQEAASKMKTDEKVKTLQFDNGEWDAITAPFLDCLKGKDPDYIKGFLEGLSTRFNVK